MKTCLRCLTCNQGEHLKAWAYRRTRFDKWSLNYQMCCGVCLSIACVLSTMGISISVSIAASFLILFYFLSSSPTQCLKIELKR